jgi:integrase
VGFLPKVTSRKATAWLYPDEDLQLLASSVSIERRVLYGFLAREGCRLSEALSLRWLDLDLERGVIRLDKNKTDDPRSWMLSPGVATALRSLGGDKPGTALVFTPLEAKAADLFRSDLADAGVERPELFERSKTRRPIRVHDLRATFVTLSLANNRTEAWVADRTGHQSSAMINRYRRAARHAAEPGLGELAPLDVALGLAAPPQGGASNDSNPGREAGTPSRPPPVAGSGVARRVASAVVFAPGSAPGDREFTNDSR